jgi:catechol 2,3-dioxygenase-like lactoylglutathione lyase family enzyme
MNHSFHISKVDHTGIAVRSLDESLRFWVDALGFEVLMRDKFPPGEFMTQVIGVPNVGVEVAFLSRGDHTIELCEYSTPEEPKVFAPRPCDIGSFHVCLLTDNVEATLSRVAAAGWTAVGVPQTVAVGPKKGMRVVYVRGPDGTTVEFWQPPREP